MVRHWVVAALIVLVLGSSLGTCLAAAKDPTPAEKEASKLVTRALEAGIAGDQEKRRTLLEEALKASPDYAPAHWQLGHVKADGKWQTSAAAAAAAKDDRYAEYRKLRE